MVVYKIIPKARLICVRNVGKTGPDDTVDFLQKVQKDPLYHLDYDCLSSNAEMTSFFDPQGLYQVKEALSEHIKGQDRRPTKTAIISPQDAHFGMSRMFEIITENTFPIQIAVFRDFPSALTWLGRRHEELEGFFEEDLLG